MAVKRPVPQRPVPVIRELDVQDLAQDGRGLARHERKAVFVAGALPGERVRARINRQGKDFDEAQALEVLQPSPQRVVPDCAHFGRCGGCALQHLDIEAQRTYKQKQLLDSLQRIARLAPQELVPPLIGDAWGYRRRARLGAEFDVRARRMRLGFRERDGQRIVAIERCPVLDPRIATRLDLLSEALSHLSLRDALTHVEVLADASAALVLRVMREPSAEDLHRLRELQASTGWVLWLQSGAEARLRPLIEPAPVLDYSPDGSEDRLNYAPGDFLQSNAALSAATVRQAIDWLALPAGARLLELFCGLGNFSIPLARRGAAVTAVEGSPELVRRARSNAAALGLEIGFHVSNLFEPNQADRWWRGPWDAVLLDPPRAGAQAAISMLAAQSPEVVLYVSCHPGTLARDAAVLTSGGYRLERLGMIDMFPHTTHIEAMALFVRTRRRAG